MSTNNENSNEIEERCMCGRSRQNAKLTCYFPTDLTVDYFHFGNFFQKWDTYLDSLEGGEPAMTQQEMIDEINRSLNFFGTVDLASADVEKCTRFATLAESCRAWMRILDRSDKAARLNYGVLNDTYRHFHHAFFDRINELTPVEGEKPSGSQPYLSSAQSCMPSE